MLAKETDDNDAFRKRNLSATSSRVSIVRGRDRENARENGIQQCLVSFDRVDWPRRGKLDTRNQRIALRRVSRMTHRAVLLSFLIIVIIIVNIHIIINNYSKTQNKKLVISVHSP